jgi:hypothetical protein
LTGEVTGKGELELLALTLHLLTLALTLALAKVAEHHLGNVAVAVFLQEHGKLGLASLVLLLHGHQELHALLACLILLSQELLLHLPVLVSIEETNATGYRCSYNSYYAHCHYCHCL